MCQNKLIYFTVKVVLETMEIRFLVFLKINDKRLTLLMGSFSFSFFSTVIVFNLIQYSTGVQVHRLEASRLQ